MLGVTGLYGEAVDEETDVAHHVESSTTGAVVNGRGLCFWS